MNFANLITTGIVFYFIIFLWLIENFWLDMGDAGCLLAAKTLIHEKKGDQIHLNQTKN